MPELEELEERVTFANKYSELARRQPDVRECFSNIMFASAKLRKIVVNKVISFFYIAHRRRTLYVSEITIYFMRYVSIGSKCPNVSGVQGKSLHTTQSS